MTFQSKYKGIPSAHIITSGFLLLRDINTVIMNTSTHQVVNILIVMNILKIDWNETKAVKFFKTDL